MNTNDLPPAAKLAALIEAGRAANPDLEQGRELLLDGDDLHACAIGFACLGLGIPRERLRGWGTLTFINVEREELPYGLVDRVMEANDSRSVTLDDICTSLREGELAKIPA